MRQMIKKIQSRIKYTVLQWVIAIFTLPLVVSNSQATTFILEQENTRVVGHNLIVYSRAQDTLLDIARRFDIGYSEIVSANPDLDVWLPGAGQRVVVPNRFILPDAPQKGIVINLAEMRLYYYPEPKSGQTRQVITHPIGIGREGWQTPLGKTKIIQKRKDPTWTPPESIRAEHIANGEPPLPKVVAAGPDNPLGAYAMRLGMPGYLLHGTNRPYGVGLRVSHGCIRLFPEDIEHLFSHVDLNTSVEILYQPYKAAMHNGILYVEAHQTYEDMQTDSNNMTPMVKAILAAKDKLSDDDWLFAQTMIEQGLGVASPITEMEDKMVEDVWFIHSGLAQGDKTDLQQALVDLEIGDAIWPIRGAQGEVLLGPFESRDQADKLADKIYNRTSESVWVSLLTAEVL